MMRGFARVVLQRAGRSRFASMIFACLLCMASNFASLIAAPAHALPFVDGPAATRDEDPRWLSFRAFSSVDGLPQNTVFALAEDREGYVWVGTQEGLARYDGRRFERVPLGASGTWVLRLWVDAKSGLWVGTDEAGLWLIDGDSRAITDHGRALPSIEALVPAADGRVWVGTPNGVYRCAREGCDFIEATRGIALAALYESECDAGRCLYLGTAMEGVRRLDHVEGERPTLGAWRLTRDDGLPNDAVRAFARLPGAARDELWIGTGRGIARWLGDRVVRYAELDGHHLGTVLDLRPSHDAQGQPEMLAGLFRGGVARFRADGGWRVLDAREGLPDDYVYSLLLTETGEAEPTLWVGTASAGLLRREPGRWLALDERQGLPHRGVVGLGETEFPDGVRAPWIGTISGSVRWHEGRWQPWLQAPFRDRVVYAIARHDDATWVGTDRGLLRLRGDRIDEFTADHGDLPGIIVTDVIAAPMPDGTPTLWVATRHGLVRLEHDRFVPEFVAGENAGWEQARGVVAVPEASGGFTIWAGFEDGLARRDARGWTPVPEGCLPHRQILDLRLADGALWVGTRRGIARVSTASPYACATFPASIIAPNMVTQLQLDARGRVYAFGHDGVDRLAPGSDPNDLGTWTVEHFDQHDGLPALEFNPTSMVDGQGRVWAGTVAGATVFDPRDESRAGEPKPLRLTAVTLDTGETVRDGDELPAARHSLRFDVHLMNLQREHRHRYQTALTGPSSIVTDWSADSRASFSRLAPGDYSFAAWARDDDGVVSGPTTLSFRIAPPWWQRAWAWLGFAAIAAALGALAVRWRTARIAARARALSDEVALRTRELAEANERLRTASLTDPLTGLWNRRYVALEIPADAERALRRRRAGEPHGDLVVLLVDIDHFKAINDRAGHDGGDIVLREFAARLREFARGSDLAVRWGGEEFLLILRDCDRAEGAEIARRLLARVRDTPFAIEGQSLRVTTSIGWAAFPFDPDGELRFDQVLNLADQALYRAKHEGRDRAIGVRAGAAGVEFVGVDEPAAS